MSSSLILLSKNDDELNAWAGENPKILDDELGTNYSILQKKIYVFSNEGISDETYNDFIKRIINISIGNNPDTQIVLAIHFGEGKIEQNSEEMIRVQNIVTEMSLENKVKIVPYSLGSGDKGYPNGINTIYKNIKKEKDQSKIDEQYKELLSIFQVATEQEERNNRISEFENLQLYIQSLSLMLKVFQKSSKISKSLLSEIKDVLPQLKEQNIDNGITVNLDGKLKKGNLFSETDLDSMISDCKEITDRLEKEKNRIRNKNETP